MPAPQPRRLKLPAALPAWSLVLPPAALALLLGLWGRVAAWPLLLLVAAALLLAVLAAVHHAEVVAHRVGEPFGTLVLAVAVTVIEAALIVSLMLSGGASASALPRDTVFAAIMIVCNGAVGLCILAGGIRHRVLRFRVEGSAPAFGVLIALATLTLVLPAYTATTPGPTFSTSQLIFAGLMSLVLYGMFVFVQTVRHRDYFLPEPGESDADADGHADPPSGRVALAAFGLLLACLVAVVGLAKLLAPSIEHAVEALHAPRSLVGVLVALLVLLPETWAAVRAAWNNRLQTSLNLALGSALASIGLTIPVVAALSVLMLDYPLALGLPPKEIVLLLLTFLVGIVTLASGRTTVLQGTVHLVLFAVFVFLAVVP